MKLLTQVLLRTQRLRQLIFAVVGVLLGFCLILIPVQLFFDFNSLVSDSEQAIGSQFLVLNKRVSVLNTLKLGNGSFSESEIKQLNSSPVLKKVGKFTSNAFEAHAMIEVPAGGASATMRTELFLESVDDAFLDVKPREWNWDETQEVVPIILPNDFINLYNFNFAPGRGLPQISKSTIKLASFIIEIHGVGGSAVYKGKIAGFSNRITSVLVPNSFMQFANQKYGALDKPSQSYRVIVEAKNNQLNKLQQYVESQGYEVNTELLKNGKFSSLLEAILVVVTLLGFLVILVSVSSFLLYVQLAITRSKNELEILLRLGYPHRKIIQWYGWNIAAILLLVFVVSYLLLIGVKNWLSHFISDFGFEIAPDLNQSVVVGGGILLFVIWIIQWISVRQQLYQLALPKRV